MKKTTFLTFIVLLLFNSVNAQLLLNDDFDNYTLGNLGTDPTGVISGQGNWFTKNYSTTTPNSSVSTITNEPFKSKVLTLTTPKDQDITVSKDLSIFIDYRTAGNNVIKFEIDYYTGPQYYMASSNPPHTQISLLNNDNKQLLKYYHLLISEVAYVHGRSTNGFTDNNVVHLGNGTWGDKFPIDTWISLIVYLDYNNKKIYFETPYFNKVAVGDFLNLSTSTNLIEDYKPTSISLSTNADIAIASQMVHKFDNIKVTAIKVVPPNIIALSINEQLAENFNLYPNPATSIVNITNNENMSIKQVEIYDVTGKLINTHNFNNETEIQLNIETLTSGTYLMHLYTNEGVAVKKLIKK